MSRTITRSLATTLLALATLATAVAQVNTNRMMQIGRNALYFEDYVLSIQYFNRVIIVKPYMADPYYYRAIAKFYLEDIQGCEADCDIALSINPFLVGAYNLRGISRLRQEKPSSAREDFTAGLKIEEDNVNLLLNLGIANINLKEYDQAISHYDDLLERDKNNVPAILYRGIAMVEKGDSATALSEFKRATELNPYSPDAYTYLGMLAYQLNDYNQALQVYNKLTELRPRDAQVLVNRAITKYNLDNMRGAMDDLDEALRLDPKSKMAYTNRGMLRAEAGALNDAAADFSRALALDPSDDIVLFNRANIYLELGQTNNALQDLNIIIAKHPEFSPAYAQRSRVKLQMGDKKGAEIDYATAMSFEEERVKRGLANANKPDQEPDEETKSTEKRASRSKNDNDMKKYNQMVVVADFGDNDNKLSQDNKESIRGRVQDRDITIDLEPVFMLTFFSGDTILPTAPYYKHSVEQFNRLKLTDSKLVIANREASSDALTANIFETISAVSAQLEESPDEANLYLLRGTLYSTVMNYSNAITDFSACIINDPSNINALFNRAAARYKMVETIRDMESDASRPMTGELMGTANIKTEVTYIDYDLIIQDLTRILELDPSNEFAYYNLALVYCQRKAFDRALDALDRAIFLNTQLSEAYFNRGLIKLYMGDETAGAQDLSHAGEMGMFKAYNVLKRVVSGD